MVIHHVRGGLPVWLGPVPPQGSRGIPLLLPLWPPRFHQKRRDLFRHDPPPHVASVRAKGPTSKVLGVISPLILLLVPPRVHQQQRDLPRDDPPHSARSVRARDPTSMAVLLEEVGPTRFLQ